MKILCIFTTVKHQFKIVKNLRYNGNIISMQWQNGASAAKSGYKFSYDGLNRLTSAILWRGRRLGTW